MGGIFARTDFNGDISTWDVSSVTDMNVMFWKAQLFNCDISDWDVSKVTYMDYMFKNAASFKQKLCGAAWRCLGAFTGKPNGHVCGIFWVNIAICMSSITISTMASTMASS